MRTQKKEMQPRLGHDLAEAFEPLLPEPTDIPLTSDASAGGTVSPVEKEAVRKQIAQAKSTPQAEKPSSKNPVMEIEELKKMMAVIAPSGVKIRSGPGQEHWVVETKFKGATLAATRKVKGKDWIRVSLPTGIQGYVFAPLLADIAGSSGQGAKR